MKLTKIELTKAFNLIIYVVTNNNDIIKKYSRRKKRFNLIEVKNNYPSYDQNMIISFFNEKILRPLTSESVLAYIDTK